MSVGTGPRAGAAARGVAWAFVAAAVTKFAWMIGLVVLARLLAPEHFGLFAFALVFIAYVETVGDLGTGAALIHWPDRRRAAAQVTFWASLATGVAWFAAAQLAAPAVAAFFHSPDGEPLLRVLAFSFLIRALGNTHDALCRKDLRFRARLLPEAALGGGKALVAVVLALQGLGVWSLVAGQLAGLALQTVALWFIVRWRPRWWFPRDLVRPMLRYGSGIVAVNVLAAVVHHIDIVVVGRVLGATTLGFYQLATKVPAATLTVVLWTVSQVLFPAFSRTHAGGGDLSRSYLTAMRYASLLTVPAAIGLMVAARPLVLALFGSTWTPAVPILRALAAYVGLRSLENHAGDVLKATGRTRLLAAMGAAKAVVLVPALLIAAPHGATAVAGTLAAVTGGTALLPLAVVGRLLGVPARETAAALAPSLLVGVLVLLVLSLYSAWAPVAAPWLDLLAMLALGSATFVAATARVEPAALRAAWDLLRPRGADVGARASRILDGRVVDGRARAG